MKFNNKVNEYLNESTQNRSQLSWVNSVGTKLWYKDAAHSDLHREDGPAVEYKDGRTEWWINGDKLSPKAIKEIKKKLKLKEEIIKHKNNRIDPGMLEDYL